MLQITPFEKHVEEYEAWFDKHPAVFQSEIMAIRQQMRSLPENLTGLEVGTGTGRYAEALGIKEGVEPSEEMAKRAVRRGVEVINALREINSVIKILAVTGGGVIEPGYYANIAGSLGADMTLQKPFSLQKLLDSVDDLVG